MSTPPRVIHLAAELPPADKPDMMKVAGTAYSGGAMMLGWWEYPLVIDMAGMEMPDEVPLLVDHDNRAESRVGMVKPGNAKGTLSITGEVMANANEAAANVAKQARAGMAWQLSLGAEVLQLSLIPEKTTLSANGQTVAGPVYHVQKSRLREVSVVPAGADASTRLSIAAALAITPAGGPHMAADNAQPTAPAATVQAAAPVDVHAALVAERQRVAEIKRICYGEHTDIEAKAIEDGSAPADVAKLVLAALRANRPKLPNVLTPSGAAADNKTVEAALCLATNCVPEAKLLASYGQQAVEQGDQLRRVGFRRMAEQVCARSGVQLPQAMGREWIRAAFSTADLTGICGNVANKALSAAFTSVEQVVPLIARAVSHSNLHSHTVYSLAASGDLEAVGPSGEVQNLELGEESRTRQVTTKGARVVITEDDLLNDELGAFTQMAQMLGMKAVTGREKALATLVNATGAGSSHFTSARGNYISGSTTNLGTDGVGLGLGVKAFRALTDPSGNPMGLLPSILLVPPAIEAAARALYVATNPASAANVNVWAGQFRPVVWSWLGTAGGQTGSSDTAWYIITDPASMPAFEVAYLNGQQVPTVEFFGVDSDANSLGVSWRIVYRFGAALAEYRAGVKSKGAA